MSKVQDLERAILSFDELQDFQDERQPNAKLYNAELAQLRRSGQSSWLTGPWLFDECYLYTLLRSFFEQSQTLKQYDPFRNQKRSTFASSKEATLKLVSLLEDAIANPSHKKHFFDIIHSCLWGNATDLSLLTNLSEADIVSLQSGTAAERAGQILANDLDAVYEYISTLKDARLDFVLDNSGFEVFTDFVLADWLVTASPFFNQVVFHPKTIPWFVSDVVNDLDIQDMLEALEALEGCEKTVARWRQHLEEGRFQISTPSQSPIGSDIPLANFWTSPYDFRQLPAKDPALLQELQHGSLTIFKGDLNYRKLTGDLCWETEVPFAQALGDLNGKLNVVALRTLKADVIVGLQGDQAKALDRKDERWRVNGKYAVISFAKRI